jgi:hypothetical protein
VSGQVEIPGDIAARVSALCLALPEVSVRTDLSEVADRSTAHSFEIRRRSFCLLVARAGPAGQPVPLLVLRARPHERAALLASGYPFRAGRAGPDRVVAELSAGTDWAEISELVTESYRMLAPRKLTALLGPAGLPRAAGPGQPG